MLSIPFFKTFYRSFLPWFAWNIVQFQVHSHPMKKKPRKDHHQKLDKALLNFRKAELQAFADYLSSPARIVIMNFLAGTMRGLGFFVGAAILLTILVFVITQILSQIPIVGEFFQWLGEFLQKNVGGGSGGSLPPAVGG